MVVDGAGVVLGCMVGEIGVRTDITRLIPDIGSNAQVEPGARKLLVAIHLLANEAIRLQSHCFTMLAN
jgi:hypothetical protein